MESYEKFLAAMNEVKEKEKFLLKENLRAVCGVLIEAGFDRAVITYQGGGDSGEFHNPVLFRKGEELETAQVARAQYGSDGWLYDPKGGEFSSDREVVIKSVRRSYTNGSSSVEVSSNSVSLADALAGLASSFVYIHHPGWENNDGAEGEVTILAEEMQISMDHTSFYTSSETYSHEFAVVPGER